MVSEDIKNKLIQMFDEGYNREEMAEETGLEPSKILCVLRENGIIMDDKIPLGEAYRREFAKNWNKARRRFTHHKADER